MLMPLSCPVCCLWSVVLTLLKYAEDNTINDPEEDPDFLHKPIHQDTH